jgi:hypothetical protein
MNSFWTLNVPTVHIIIIIIIIITYLHSALYNHKTTLSALH